MSDTASRICFNCFRWGKSKQCSKNWLGSCEAYTYRFRSKREG